MALRIFPVLLLFFLAWPLAAPTRAQTSLDYAVDHIQRVAVLQDMEDIQRAQENLCIAYREAKADAIRYYADQLRRAIASYFDHTGQRPLVAPCPER